MTTTNGIDATASIARRDSEKQPDSVTVGAYTGKLEKKGADCGLTGHGTCPAPNTIKSDLSGSGRNRPEASVEAISGGGRSCAYPGLPVLESDTRTPRQRHPLTYSSWRSMKARARRLGHKVDTSWLGVDGFSAFLADMGPRPNADFTLDRMDSNLREYGPGLCRWASKKTQTENRRNTVHLTDASGTCRSLGEWARLTGTKPDTMLKRRDRGLPDHEVIHGPGSPAKPQEPTPGRWPPVSDNSVAYWRGRYADRAWRGESRFEFVYRTAVERLQFMRNHFIGESEMEYLEHLVSMDEELGNDSPEALAAAERLNFLNKVYEMMVISRDWAQKELRKIQWKKDEACRAQEDAEKWRE